MSFNQIGRYDEEFDDRWREMEKQREKEKDNFDRGPIEERRVEFEARMMMMMMMVRSG